MSELITPDYVQPERVLMVINPKASRADRCAADVRSSGLPVTAVETSLSNEETRDRLIAHSAEGSLVWAVGGDGTTHKIGNILLRDEMQNAGFGNVPFVPGRGGNANDIARMVNGKNNASKIVKHGKPVLVSPIEVSMYSEAGHSMHYAFGYFGIGNTATAAAQLDSLKESSTALKRWTGFQFGREAVTSFNTVSRTETFAARLDGHDVELTDYVAARGNRMAKVGRPSASLEQPYFQSADIRTTGRLSTLGTMARLGAGMLNKPLVNGAQLTLHEGNGGIAAQIDGEQLYIPDGAHIDLEITDAQLILLSTRVSGAV